MKTNIVSNNVSDMIVSNVVSVVKDHSDSEWIGTMTALNAVLVREMGRKNVPTTWPGSPSALRVAINRVVNRLRNKGVSVRFVRTPDHARTRLVVFSMQ